MASNGLNVTDADALNPDAIDPDPVTTSICFSTIVPVRATEPEPDSLLVCFCDTDPVMSNRESISVASNGLKVALRLLNNPPLNNVPDPDIISVWESIADPVNVTEPEPVAASMCFSTRVPVTSKRPTALTDLKVALRLL